MRLAAIAGKICYTSPMFAMALSSHHGVRFSREFAIWSPRRCHLLTCRTRTSRVEETKLRRRIDCRPEAVAQIEFLAGDRLRHAKMCGVAGGQGCERGDEGK